MSDGSVGRSKSPEKIKFLFLSINRVSVFTQDAPLNIQSKSLHGKPYFLFPDVLKRWYFQKIALEHDLSCIIGKDDISFSGKYDLTP